MGNSGENEEQEENGTKFEIKWKKNIKKLEKECKLLLFTFKGT